MRERSYRPISRFCEDEIVIPSTGAAFRCSTQPYSKHWFAGIESDQYSTHLAIGPSQSGKTFHGFVCPILWHLFETRETVLVGCPSADIVSDKWNLDIRPAIERSRYRELLPQTGEGARGGDVKSLVKFQHGPALRFMTAGGGDKSRAHFTSRVLVITEVDDFDVVGKQSKESTKLKQLFARQRRFPRAMRRTYAECTVTDKRAYTWRTWLAGTASTLRCPCPHCGVFSQIEREHLVGWKNADNEDAAAELGAFACPKCGALWSETDRRYAVENAVTVHKGQRVLSSGQVVGPSPKTSTFALRWNAAHNLFLPSGDFAVEEWNIEQDEDPDEGDQEAHQFSWAIPWEPDDDGEPELEPKSLKRRFAGDEMLTRSFVPRDAEHLTVGVDLGKRYGHYVVTAWFDGQIHVVEYGVFDIAGDELDVDVAILKALREFRETVLDRGWPVVGTDQYRQPDAICIDSGYQGDNDKDKTTDPDDSVYRFCMESNRLDRGNGVRVRRYWPSKGFGETRYSPPRRQTQRTNPLVGWHYHVSKFTRRGRKIELLIFNADRWKQWIHARLRVRPGERGSLVFYAALSKNEHTKFVNHLCAEVLVEEFVAGRGVVRKMVRKRKQNHWLDAIVLSAIAAHKRGFRTVERDATTGNSGGRTAGRRRSSSFALQGGRSWQT